MPAVAVHHTEISKGVWDGPANKTRAKTGEDASYYKKIFAWQDPDSDDKSNWKFIHHEVDGDGNPGNANMTACSSGIAVLNGARKGTTIPDADRAGVYRHLAAHMKDGDMEAPELKSFEAMERRVFDLDELRVSEDGQPKIEGHAAVFGQLSEMLWGFKEQIARGAFKKTIQEADIRALFNHDPNYVLGRNKADTLTLSEDRHGLATQMLPPDTQWARDLMVSMRRGDINQQSFGFQVVKDRWDDLDQPVPTRTLLEVKLFDVSVVTFPAYPQTDAAVRSLVKLIRECNLGAMPESEIREAIAELQAHIPIEPLPEGHSTATDKPVDLNHLFAERERELMLVAL